MTIQAYLAIIEERQPLNEEEIAMKNILVSGLINIETTASVISFPIEYQAIDYNFFGVNSMPSGVGLNLASALTTLGDKVSLLSICGNDALGSVIKQELKNRNISSKHILSILSQTPQSVVLYDKNGKRQIICDLKDAQETTYNIDIFKTEAKNCDCLCLCNINFSREMLPIAKELNKLIVTDVHVISSLDDEYNRDFMQYADILFMSNENLGNAKSFVKETAKRFGNSIIVVGMGSQGSLLYTKSDDSFTELPIYKTRKAVNTIGAGDALLSAFTHFYTNGCSPKDSLKLASIFASYKIGDKSASSGFLTEQELLKLAENI